MRFEHEQGMKDLADVGSAAQRRMALAILEVMAKVTDVESKVDQLLTILVTGAEKLLATATPEGKAADLRGALEEAYPSLVFAEPPGGWSEPSPVLIPEGLRIIEAIRERLAAGKVECQACKGAGFAMVHSQDTAKEVACEACGGVGTIGEDVVKECIEGKEITSESVRAALADAIREVRGWAPGKIAESSRAADEILRSAREIWPEFYP